MSMKINVCMFTVCHILTTLNSVLDFEVQCYRIKNECYNCATGHTHVLLLPCKSGAARTNIKNYANG